MEKIFIEEFEPFTLTYSYPGHIVSVRCDDEEQADLAFREMFDRCGDDVKYSVDGVYYP